MVVGRRQTSNNIYGFVGLRDSEGALGAQAGVSGRSWIVLLQVMLLVAPLHYLNITWILL